MALESVKSAAAVSMNSGVQTRTAEPVRVEPDSGTNGKQAEAAAIRGGMQTGNAAGNTAGNMGQAGEQLTEQDAERRLKMAVQHANDQVKHVAKTRCEFSYHEETNRVSIKVMDSDTKEVIREIPAEETLQMIEKMWELAGILLDEKR